MSGHGRTDLLLSPIRIIVRIQEPDLHRIFRILAGYLNKVNKLWTDFEQNFTGTWTNWLGFELDPDHSPDPGSGFTPDFFNWYKIELYLQWSTNKKSHVVYRTAPFLMILNKSRHF